MAEEEQAFGREERQASRGYLLVGQGCDVSQASGIPVLNPSKMLGGLQKGCDQRG